MTSFLLNRRGTGTVFGSSISILNITPAFYLFRHFIRLSLCFFQPNQPLQSLLHRPISFSSPFHQIHLLLRSFFRFCHYASSSSSSTTTTTTTTPTLRFLLRGQASTSSPQTAAHKNASTHGFPPQNRGEREARKAICLRRRRK